MVCAFFDVKGYFGHKKGPHHKVRPILYWVMDSATQRPKPSETVVQQIRSRSRSHGKTHSKNHCQATYKPHQQTSRRFRERRF